MSYAPFERGGFPVGVRTCSLMDPARERTLPIELWYPATDEHAGRDLDDSTRDRYSSAPGFPAVPQDAVRDADARRGSFPLVVFSHGFGGHRRQTTHWCTHVASHGYLVAAVDHTGNTVADIMQIAMQRMSQGGTGSDAAPALDLHALALPMVEARPLDVVFTIDAVLDGRAGDLADRADPEHIAVSGHSFGGWTTLAMPALDPRVGALVPMAPAGGRSPLAPTAVQDLLRLDWDHDVPTLVIAAEHDTLVPLDGVRELFERAPAPRKQLVVLENADHMHFCDRIEEAHELFRLMPAPIPGFGDAAQAVRPIGELCPPAHAYRVIRGLGLAHLDAALRGDASARALLIDAGGLDLPIRVS